MFSKRQVHSVFDPRISRATYRPGVIPGHNALETDFEEDVSDLEEYAGRRSEDSAGQRSSATLSSLDELETPDTGSNEFLGFNFQLQDSLPQMKSVEGPVGPHLFRMSTDSARDLEFHMSMSPPASPEEIRAAPRRKSEPVEAAPPPRTSVPLRTWTPRQVAEWMYSSGFDRRIVDTFFINDICGKTLIDLQYDDLKELGITSFGQRHRLWTEIRALKDQKLSGFDDEPVYESTAPPAESYPEVPKPCTSQEDLALATSGRRRRRQRSADDIISPAESASIVAIEQLLPKPHKCSKGENCSKWQKQQRKLARIATEFPAEMAQIVNADRNASPTESGVAASLVVPSMIASSDIFGITQPAFRLEEESLKALQSRDPQENVRHFLTFQHVQDSKPEEPSTPPYEMFPPLSPPNAQPPHQNLRHLPKLTIPDDPAAGMGGVSARDRTARPSRGKGCASPLHGFNISQNAPTAHDLWRIGSPASEMDVPVTAIPLGPIERDVSSSVPPDMRFGNVAGMVGGSRPTSGSGFRQGPPPSFHMPMGGLQRSNSTASYAHRRRPSLTVAPPVLREERAAEEAAANSPTEIEVDGDVTPTASKPGEAHHDGWMKKRRTRMLRHEWQEAHFRLRGSQLGMHADERTRSALEWIDVDDYAVAVSAAPGSNKLNSAFRRLHIGSSGTNGKLDPHQFAFQLTPAAEKRGVRHAATGKTHHFAVRSANERIDWMRELMLARARKQKDVDIASFD